MEGTPLTLVQLIDDATDINNFRSNDAQAQAVANSVNRSINGVPNAIKLLTLKLRTRKEIIMLQTLNVLEVCAKKCGSKFHNEIGKNRFLNELIKLLSPKYEGNSTPENVKERVISILYSWYVNLPNETKIHEAYKVLKHEGIIKQDPVDDKKKVKSSGATSIHADDADADDVEEAPTPFNDKDKSQILQLLLSSKDPEDLESANQLIKTMVREEQERLDGVAKKFEVLELVKNNVALLNEMLANYDAETAGDSVQIINELYEKCVSLRPELYRLASKNIDEENDTVAEILRSSDDLTQVIDLYQDVIILKKKVSIPSTSAPITDDPEPEDLSANSSSLLDMNASGPCEPSSEDLENPLLHEQFKLLGLSSGGNVSANVTEDTEEFTPMQSSNGQLMFDTPSLPYRPSAQSTFGSLPSSSNMLPLNNAVMPSGLVLTNSFGRPVNPALNQRSYVQMPNIPATEPAVSEPVPAKKDVLDFDVFTSDFFKGTKEDENIEVATDVLEDEADMIGTSDPHDNNDMADNSSLTNADPGTIPIPNNATSRHPELPKIPPMVPLENPVGPAPQCTKPLPTLTPSDLSDSKPTETEELLKVTPVSLSSQLPDLLPSLNPAESPLVPNPIETSELLGSVPAGASSQLPRTLPSLDPAEISETLPPETSSLMPKTLPSLNTGDLADLKPVDEMSELLNQSPPLPRTLPSLNHPTKPIETDEIAEGIALDPLPIPPQTLPALSPSELPEIPVPTSELVGAAIEPSSLSPRTLPPLTPSEIPDTDPVETSGFIPTPIAELLPQLPSLDSARPEPGETVNLLGTTPTEVLSQLPAVTPSDTSDVTPAPSELVETVTAEVSDTPETSLLISTGAPAGHHTTEANISPPLPENGDSVLATSNERTSMAAHAQTSAPDYCVPLEALKTDRHPPIRVLDKDGLKTFLIVGEDTRENANAKVIVCVLSTISLNMQPLTNFKIQVACPKAMRVKLQDATSTTLPPFNPLIPPTAISQILLIANPSKEVVKLRFKINYSLGGVGCVETVNIDALPVR